jgi:hypothetical protein
MDTRDTLAPATTPPPPAAQPPRPVVWPWLVVPLITLLVFFALRSVQQGAMRERAEGPPAPAAPAALTPAG